MNAAPHLRSTARKLESAVEVAALLASICTRIADALEGKP